MPMLRNLLQDAVEEAWEARASLNPNTTGEHRKAIESALKALDSGELRVAEPDDKGGWQVNQWLKKAVLLSFLIRNSETIQFGNQSMMGQIWRDETHYGYDKVPLKTAGWTAQQFSDARFRMVPGAVVRYSAFIGKNVVLMPSFVNVGAYIGEGTMVDTWATVGSCAQIGKNVHLSGGVGIGGVLEPLQANPTIIEDGCFIGARSEVVEGVIVRRRAVLSMGVFIGKNTPIVDRTNSNKILRGEVPEGAVVMMGVHPENGLICPQIVKYRDESTNAATAINELLRD